MSRLNRYVNAQLLRFIFFALIGLLALYSFFDFVGEVKSLGRGGYQLSDALLYVLLLVPGRAYELLPVAVLMGAIFSFSLLNSQSELTVIRASGISLQRLVAWVMLAGAICAALTFILGEYIAPLSERKARQQRLLATDSMVVSQFRSGVWVKDGASFINIAEMMPDLTLHKIRIFTFSSDMKLVETREAQTGKFIGQGQWQLDNGHVTQFLPNNTGVKVIPAPQYRWTTSVSPSMLVVLLVSADQMSATALYQYIDHLRENKQKTSTYEIAFWNKLFYPLICLSMIIVALPFSMGQRRSSNIGVKLFIGIMIGLGFYFFSKVMGHLGQLYEMPPVLVVIIPPLLFLGASGYLLWRQERR
jgi:lipopolysaccharide export system permease protein